jgi:hypothetical protein
MVAGNKIIVLGLGVGQIGRRLPIFTEHLHLCNEKPHIVNLPKENNVLTDIIQQRNIETTQNLKTMFDRDFKTLVNIYNNVQHKYYPEKDVFVGNRM